MRIATNCSKYPTYLCALACLLLVVSSCKPKIPPAVTNNTAVVGYTPQYAKGFELLTDGNDKLLKVHNPWQKAEGIEFIYRLTPNPTANPRDIKYPVERAICLSSTHVAFVDMIDKTEQIVGVSGAAFISNPTIQEKVASRKVYDIGYESSLSYELVASLHPDVVFAYGIDGEMAGVETKLNEMGIKLVYIGEYMEQTPLGKAEWVVAVASFFGEENLAKERFQKVAKEYEEVKAKVAAVGSVRPKVMLNAPYKGSWYIPGGASHIACLLNDAGADYIYGGNSKIESTPMSFEAAYLKCMDADFWLTPNTATSLKDIRQMDERLTGIPAYKSGKVYNNNARMTRVGGSDFWESGVVNPQLILEDLVSIFHPDVLPNRTLYYFRHLE